MVYITTKAIKHGHAGYTRHKCRCDVCTKANTDYQLKRLHERKAYTEKHGLPAEVEHGASAYVNWGCRCTVCTAAWARKNREYYQRKRAEAAR